MPVEYQKGSDSSVTNWIVSYLKPLVDHMIRNVDFWLDMSAHLHPNKCNPTSLAFRVML